MTPIDTAELERLAASITPGPWNSSIHGNQVLTGDSWNTICEIRVRKDFSAAQWEDGRGSSDPTANARAIALVPALIREVLAHRKAEAWQPISSAPKGCITEDVGCRGPSEWFLGRVSPEFRAGRPPFIVIRRKAWPQGHSWECAGEAWYVPRFFDAWRPLPTTPEAEGGCDERA